MVNASKRIRAVKEELGDPEQERSVSDALKMLKKLSKVKFDESVELAINLGVDPKKSDQMVRGSTVLPNGTGKTVRVALFADGDDAQAGKDAGADIVGMEDLAEEVKRGNINFDLVVATPASMRIVGQLGQILGPKGLMPNPKVGTVTTDVGAAVKNAKAGQVQYRTDKTGIIHCAIGKISFSESNLAENLEAVLTDIQKAKPSASKGVYLKSVVLSTTMGPGVKVDKNSLTV